MKTLLLVAIISLGCFGQETLKNKITKIHLENDIQLLINIELFDENMHQITHCETSCEDYCIIDEQISFGNDCEAPYTKLNSIKFISKEEKLNLDVSGLYNPNLKSLDITKDRFELFSYGNGKYHILTGYFSDGAGAFIVKWLIKGSYSIRISINSV